MKTETLNVSGSDGYKLNAYVYHPKSTAKGIVHILHGMGEHAKRYEPFSKYLCEHGLIVYAHDHRHHGRSTSTKDDLGMFDKSESFETMVDDVGAVQRYIHEHEPDTPMTMLGHSMGSVILRRYLQKDMIKPDKAIIMGTLPKYNLFSGGVLYVLSWVSGLFVSKAKRHRFVNTLLNRSMTRKIPGSKNDLDWLAHHKEVVERYDEDALSGFVYNKVFYNTFFKALITLNKASNIAKTPAIKTLFISGHDDPLSNTMDAIHKLDRAYKKKIDGFQSDVKAIDDARHEVLNEKNKASTYDYLLDWIMDQSDK